MIGRAEPEKEMDDEFDNSVPTRLDSSGDPVERPVVRLRKLSEFLEQEGVEGRPRSECGKVVVQIFYDFKPEDSGPILLDWNVRDDRVMAP